MLSPNSFGSSVEPSGPHAGAQTEHNAQEHVWARLARPSPCGKSSLIGVPHRPLYLNTRTFNHVQRQTKDVTSRCRYVPRTSPKNISITMRAASLGWHSHVTSSPLQHENFGKETSELLQDGNFNNMAAESKHRHQEVAWTADDTYIHTYLHTYAGTIRNQYMHASIHACMHTYLQTSMHACIFRNPYMHANMHVCIYVIYMLLIYLYLSHGQNVRVALAWLKGEFPAAMHAAAS